MRFASFFALIPLALVAVPFATAGIKQEPSPALPDGIYAEFDTPHGMIVARLLTREAPLTTANFVGLAEGTLGPRKGRPYYSGLVWYRVVPGFVIQSGNPHHPSDGNAGYTFPDEFSPGLRHDRAGILSMANGGPDTNSAEFFITLGEQNRLNYLYSVFGRVVRGVELLPAIKQGEAFSIRILRIGAAARTFQADEPAFRDLVEKTVAHRGKPASGSSAHFDDPAGLLPSPPLKAEAFNAKLNNFECATGVRIVARLFAKSPAAEEDAVAGAYMRKLAEESGTIRRGALVAYFADQEDWRVWIGDESTGAFFGRKTTAADLQEGGAFHDTKEAFLNAVKAGGRERFAAQLRSAPAGAPAGAAEKLKLETDAMLDGLIFRLEPKDSH